MGSVSGGRGEVGDSRVVSEVAGSGEMLPAAGCAMMTKRRHRSGKRRMGRLKDMLYR